MLKTPRLAALAILCGIAASPTYAQNKAAEEENFFLRGFNYLFLMRKV